MASTFTERVLAVVRSSRPGELLTYGEVAREAGRPTAARAVGNVLRANGGAVAWWRVVTASGRLVPTLEDDQAARLAAEGVDCVGGVVVGLAPGIAGRPRAQGARSDGRLRNNAR